ncbi:MAG: AEC family transporter [Desulfatibacillaceae bacterium]
MERIAQTIIPVFLVILLGWVLARRGVLPQSVAGPLNRMVFTVAIPAMIFLKVSRAPFGGAQLPMLVACTLAAVVAGAAAAFALVRAMKVRGARRGTFCQASFHGNLGYVGLAVAFYYMGDAGLTRASILAAFLMLLQNLLSVGILEGFSGVRKRGGRFAFFAKKIAANPVIIGVVLGVGFGLSGPDLPVIAERTLDIVASMALPLALLVIGASLDFSLIREHLAPVLVAGAVKMVLVPGLGLLLYTLAGLPPTEYLPGLILLAAPTATITYVMSRELGGSPQMASAAVSVNTLLSALTYTAWLSLLS